MKVLQVNCVYNSGSTGKITYDLHTALICEGYDSRVIYGRGAGSADGFAKKLFLELYFKLNGLFSRLTGIPYGGCILSTWRLEHLIIKEKPDIVHLQCINGHFVNIYRLISWLKRRRIWTMLTLHAEFMHTANCGYAVDCEKWKTGCGHCERWREETNSWFFDRTAASWHRMKRAFEGFNTLSVVSVSPWLEARARLSPILSKLKHFTILNGVDTDIFHPIDIFAIRKELGLKDEKVIAYVTPSFRSRIKGGHYVISLAERLKDKKVRILLIGNDDTSAQLPDNIIDVGRVKDQKKIASYYSLADLTLVVSKRETFSMPVAESLCCGTPVVGFEAGGPESISILEYSEFAKYGNLDALENTVLRWLGKEKNGEAIAAAAKLKFSREVMAERYIGLYKKMTEEHLHV